MLLTVNVPMIGVVKRADCPSGPTTVKAEPSAEVDVDSTPVGVASGDREGLRVQLGIVVEAPAGLVVDVDESEARHRGRQQLALRGAVVLLRAVEVEVVVAEVEEDGDVEDHSVDPSHRDRLARHLRGTATASRIFARSACRAGASGVVSFVGTGMPSILDPIDPMRPLRRSPSAASMRNVVDVLPCVPVTPIVFSAAAGKS
jgi:hypothetical protein